MCLEEEQGQRTRRANCIPMIIRVTNKDMSCHESSGMQVDVCRQSPSQRVMSSQGTQTRRKHLFAQRVSALVRVSKQTLVVGVQHSALEKRNVVQSEVAVDKFEEELLGNESVFVNRGSSMILPIVEEHGNVFWSCCQSRAQQRGEGEISKETHMRR